MTRQSLPIVDPARTEFGFERTVCDCRACTRNCRHLPGYLVPTDLDRLHRHLAPNQDQQAWLKEHLRASPGAIVIRDGQTFRIPTLVPARRSDGVCVFLTASDKCAIHAVAPFGCAFFDTHMANAEANHRSQRGLQAVLQAWIANDDYARLWLALAKDGLVAPPPEVARQHMQSHAND